MKVVSRITISKFSLTFLFGRGRRLIYPHPNLLRQLLLRCSTAYVRVGVPEGEGTGFVDGLTGQLLFTQIVCFPVPGCSNDIV